MSTRSHHPTRTIDYRCPNNHIVEYHHAIKNCNRTPYLQSQACANEPLQSDNPHHLQSTHYRLTTNTLNDAKGVRGIEVGCPVCERENWERVWNAAVQASIAYFGLDDGGLIKVPETNVWIFEMPFHPVRERYRGKLVDTRPYRNMLPGAQRNSRGVRWPYGEYKGLNHGGMTGDEVQ